MLIVAKELHGMRSLQSALASSLSHLSAMQDHATPSPSWPGSEDRSLEQQITHAMTSSRFRIALGTQPGSLSEGN